MAVCDRCKTEIEKGPQLVWQSAHQAGTCVSCHREHQQVLVISPRHNGGFVMRMCADCLREAAAMLKKTP